METFPINKYDEQFWSYDDGGYEDYDDEYSATIRRTTADQTTMDTQMANFKTETNYKQLFYEMTNNKEIFLATIYRITNLSTFYDYLRLNRGIPILSKERLLDIFIVKFKKLLGNNIEFNSGLIDNIIVETMYECIENIHIYNIIVKKILPYIGQTPDGILKFLNPDVEHSEKKKSSSMER